MCYNVFVTSARFFRAFPAMAHRQAVLLTPSISSLRFIQGVSCAQITRETPQIPFFVFKSLRTLSFSVSRKSCVCHSYENCRGVYQQFPIWNAPRPCRGTRPCRNPSILHFRLCELCVLRRLCVNSGLSSLATVHGSLSAFAYPLFFHILADSFALTKNSTLLFSSDSKFFAQNTRGGVYIPVALVSHWPEHANRPGRLSSNA